jgi:hypothetical protein
VFAHAPGSLIFGKTNRESLDIFRDWKNFKWIVDHEKCIPVLLSVLHVCSQVCDHFLDDHRVIITVSRSEQRQGIGTVDQAPSVGQIVIELIVMISISRQSFGTTFSDDLRTFPR